MLRKSQDVLDKCRSVHNILIYPEVSLEDRVNMLELELAASHQRVTHEVIGIFPRTIGTAAIFLKGGRSLNQDYLSEQLIERVDECWPDLVLLLDQGRVIIKQYLPHRAPNALIDKGSLEFYDLAEDALLAFTVGLFAFLTERSTQVESPLNLTQYVRDLATLDPTSRVDFPSKSFRQHRLHLWRVEEGEKDRLEVIRR